MKNFFFPKSTLLLSLLLFAACDPKDDSSPDPLLDLMGPVGFQGTLPNGETFGTADIRSANGVTGMGSTGLPFQGRHILSIRDLDTGWDLSLELPSVAFETPPPAGEHADPEPIYARFREEYPYELVKEKLLVEKQNAATNTNYSSVSLMRLSLSQQREYFAYLHDGYSPAEAGKIRIMDILEGTEQNGQGQDVRAIIVTVELDLKMQTIGIGVDPQVGFLKGTAQFKFREDFDQSQFAQ